MNTVSLKPRALQCFADPVEPLPSYSPEWLSAVLQPWYTNWPFTYLCLQQSISASRSVSEEQSRFFFFFRVMFLIWRASVGADRHSTPQISGCPARWWCSVCTCVNRKGCRPAVHVIHTVQKLHNLHTRQSCGVCTVPSSVRVSTLKTLTVLYNIDDNLMAYFPLEDWSLSIYYCASCSRGISFFSALTLGQLCNIMTVCRFGSLASLKARACNFWERKKKNNNPCVLLLPYYLGYHVNLYSAFQDAKIDQKTQKTSAWKTNKHKMVQYWAESWWLYAVTKRWTVADILSTSLITYMKYGVLKIPGCLTTSCCILQPALQAVLTYNPLHRQTFVTYRVLCLWHLTDRWQLSLDHSGKTLQRMNPGSGTTSLCGHIKSMGEQKKR